MRLIKKHNIEDVDEEVSSNEELKVKNGRRRRKKEPSKPWTKKERYLVLGVLFVTVFVSSILGLAARGWKLPKVPRMVFPKISLFDSSPIVIENTKNKGLEARKRQAEKIVSYFKSQTDQVSGVWGLYIEDLNSGYSFGVYEDEKFQAASLIKLPVMAGIYLEIEKGNLISEEIYKLKESDKLGGAGSLYTKPAGFEISIKDLVCQMGKQSDNTAFKVGVGLLGEEKLENIISEIGMKETSYGGNSTKPRDVGIFFSRLWNGEIVNKENKEELLDCLTDTSFEEWLSSGSNLRISHKYGRDAKVVNDAGIVYSSNPFVVVILSKSVVEREADLLFPSLSKGIIDRMIDLSD